jgi:hypothetical protein
MSENCSVISVTGNKLFVGEIGKSTYQDMLEEVE